jgi:undecaprenyl-diphosphatase
MAFLRFLEGLRTPFFDGFFSIVTHLGEETAFLVIAITVFWCIDKRRGYFTLITCLIGTLVNQTLKLLCKIPRPWRDPTFTAVESAIPEATGYSFPSGHTQNATGTFLSLAVTSGRKWVRVIFVTLIALVAFSRMYLGVHTPYDVAFSLVFGTALVFALAPAFKTEEGFRRSMPYITVGSLLLALGYLIYAFSVDEGSVDIKNLISARENAVTLFTLALCLIIVYFLDTKFIKFETGGAWYVQLIKLVFGFGILLLIKEGLRSPLISLFGNEYVARGVRYFLVVIFAGVIWPLCFKYLSRIRIKALDGLFSKKTK